MREILFRGKRTDNGKWVFGFLHKMDGYGTGYTEYGIQIQDTSTSRPWSVLVIPETVGQFTGLTDKNGKKIFEGDIVKVEGKHYEVKYMLGQFFIGINMPIAYKRFECEIVGNIHDNPELLKGGE